MTCPVTADLNRYLADEDRHAKYEEAVEAKALELRGEWTMELWQSPSDGLWCWNIENTEGDCIDNEWCKTESEAWAGLRDGVDRASKKAAKRWMEQDHE